MARKLFGCLIVAALALAGVAVADGIDTALSTHHFNKAVGEMVDQAAVLGMQKMDVDTVFLLGGPGTLEGKFQTTTGIPNWHGWTSEDFTNDETYAWNISTNPDYVIDGTYVGEADVSLHFDDLQWTGSFSEGATDSYSVSCEGAIIGPVVT